MGETRGGRGGLKGTPNVSPHVNPPGESTKTTSLAVVLLRSEAGNSMPRHTASQLPFMTPSVYHSRLTQQTLCEEEQRAGPLFGTPILSPAL